MKAKEFLVRYWMKYYLQDDICSLCGQTGIITPTGKGPRGQKLHSNYCFCPNGQKMRKLKITLPKE